MTRAVRAGQRVLPLLSLMATVHNTYTLSALEFVLDSFDPESLRVRGRSLKAFDCFRTPSGAQIFSSPSFRGSRERLRSSLAGCFEVGKFGASSLDSRAGQRFLQTRGDAVDWDLAVSKRSGSIRFRFHEKVRQTAC